MVRGAWQREGFEREALPGVGAVSQTWPAYETVGQGVQCHSATRPAPLLLHRSALLPLAQTSARSIRLQRCRTTTHAGGTPIRCAWSWTAACESPLLIKRGSRQLSQLSSCL